MKDLRDFIKKCEEEGELKKIKAEVDWDLEISHITRLNEERRGPALLFENVRECEGSVLAGALSTEKRLAIALQKPFHYTLCDLAREWKDIQAKTKQVIPAQEVKTGPVTENIIEGKEIDLRKLPVPRFYERDGGRYIGTAAFMIIRDPETRMINMGTYRMQLLDERSTGVQMLKGKRGERILGKYRKLGKPMPAAIAIGCDPIYLMAGSVMIEGASQFDIVGTLRETPSETIISDLTGLPLPARAEIILEGEVDPDDLRDEGPFGEYTGYYSDEWRERIPKPAVKINRVLYRNNPILWVMSQGRPVTDTHMLLALTRTATLWTDLDQMKIPGIQSVCVMPESAGRFWAIVSVKQIYPGHSSQVASAVISTTTGSYGIKGVIVVDEDIRADDISRVFWALAVRYDPCRGTEIIKRGRSTPLDPALDPDNRFITSRILMDATIPFEWRDKPYEIKTTDSVMDKVRSRWTEYGLD
ncbi:phenylphosphate carboxylase subunit beta [Dehalococcoidia bacterium]|nr:phenylphosphate carboxylase subunit beta [Dehalococcoidia bacterium]